MSTTWKAAVFGSIAVVLALAVLLGGFYLGRATSPAGRFAIGRDYQPHSPMMGRGSIGPSTIGSGMMGSGSWGPGMMSGMMDPGVWGPTGQFGPGLRGHGPMMGGARPGMMGWYGSQATEADPIEVEAAEDAALEYLERYGYEGLEIAEVMVFDNHAYVQVVETDTGIGAMELLVDPVSGNAYPEHGPNMMWNVKYSPMGMGSMMMGRGMVGGMMGSYSVPDLDDFEMEVSGAGAVELAQAYLERANSALTADDHADAFYGYYTIHTLLDGEVTGMLSVNGFTGDVFVHTWHGTLLEMSDH